LRDEAVVEVYSAGNAAEAHGLNDALQAAGVESRVVGDFIRSNWATPALQVVAPRIWVRKQDEQAAREIIAEWQAERRPNGDDVTE
jgi:hypothetical protein